MIIKIPNIDEVVNIAELEMEVTVQEVIDVYNEHIQLCEFLALVDSGVFTLSYNDYTELPDLLISCIYLYKNEKTKIMSEKAK